MTGGGGGGLVRLAGGEGRLGVALTGTWIGWDCLMLGARDLAPVIQKSWREGSEREDGNLAPNNASRLLRQGAVMKVKDWRHADVSYRFEKKV